MELHRTLVRGHIEVADVHTLAVHVVHHMLAVHMGLQREVLEVVVAPHPCMLHIVDAFAQDFRLLRVALQGPLASGAWPVALLGAVEGNTAGRVGSHRSAGTAAAYTAAGHDAVPQGAVVSTSLSGAWDLHVMQI
jgi:hypothetical protein